MSHITILVNGEPTYAFDADRYTCEQTRGGKFTMEAQGPPLKQGSDFGVPGVHADSGELGDLLSVKITDEILPTQ